MKKHSFTFPRLKYKQDGIINFVEYKHKRFKLVYVVMIILLLIALFIAIFPLFFLLIQAFKTPEEINSNIFKFWPEVLDLGKIIDVWQVSGLGVYFTNTIIVLIGAIISSIIFNGLLAYGVSIVKPIGSKFVYGLILGSYMIPTVLSIIPLYAMIVNLKLINSFIPLWFAFGANAFYFINFKNYFDKIPKELVESMRVDGCGDFQIFFKLILPISKPIIGTIAILATSAAWGDFLLPKLVLMEDSNFTLMVKLFSINATMGTVAGYTPDMLLMALLLSIIPQIFIFLIFQKQITGGSLEGGIKE
ncbi:MAG: carbohydrate ABC transporter permease [Bacilli bacterium]|jgi:multiple sugar transport system permease protein|nr:carbohydrate ABC transporter permease [Bacilli bacterium]